ncbi:MAG: hypothetical protein IT220_08890 [Flavobacteriaceae bacterium]|nr:hypothetical protein [Flavobacteriaceae bacterium]
MKIKIILILLGSLFAFTLYQSYHYDNIFQVFIYALLGIPWIIIFGKTIVKLKNTKSNYSTFIVGLLILILNIGISIFYETKVNSETLIKAQIFGGYADFKKNGDYVIISGSWASRTHFYGTYELIDSFIVVDRDNFDDVLTTNRFVIRKSDTLEKVIYKDKNIVVDKYLIQIDKNGNEIKREYNQLNYRLPVLINKLEN